MARKGSALMLTIDIRKGVEAVASKWIEFGEEALYRAAQFSVNGVAIDASRRFRERVPTILDRPTQKTLDGIVNYEVNRDGLKGIKSLAGVSASINVGPLVSIWTKYQFGTGLQRREPGDVGLAQDSIWLPFWDNITVSQGVRPDRHGNVPDGFVGRIKREIKGSVAKGRKKTQWRIWEGPWKVKGVERKAIIAAPPRVKDPTGAKKEFLDPNGRKRVVPQMTPVENAATRKAETPRVLFIEVDHVDHQPRLQEPWNESAAKAAETFADRLDHELINKHWHKRTGSSTNLKYKRTQGRRV